MSRINEIQNAILALGPGAYQKFMDAYLIKKYGFSGIMPLGSKEGTDKTTKGTPDSFVRNKDGKFILIAHGTVSDNQFAKIEADILACLDQSKTGIDREDICRIICCHTSTNLNPGQVKELCSHFNDIVLVGLGDVSYDVCLKYPDIARDFLNIRMDTHQIFDVEDYVGFTSQNPYATTLDMPLLCRDSELSKALTLLDQHSVLMIFGASGIGKTRFAIEIAQQYAREHNYTLKVIQSNNESIYEDLVITFVDDKDYIVLVDDADRLIQISILLQMSLNPGRQHKTKMVMTVRDYAKEKLMRDTRKACDTALFELGVLSDESIAKILKENLNITNTRAIKKIQDISKGNIRLAIMAGHCMIRGDIDKITNAFDIFNDYFSEIVACYNREEQMVAAIVSLFQSFELDRSDLPFSVAAEYGISADRFTASCYDLHKKEVINIYENKGIKIENQNIRDYLLYRVLLEEKWISIARILEITFPKYRDRIIYAVNTLINLFNSDNNVTYIDDEIKTAWSDIRGKSEDDVMAFIEMFYPVIPDEALAYVKRAIAHLTVVQRDLTRVDFENIHGGSINSRLITLLKGFKYTECFDDAIHLALSYFERNTEHAEDIWLLFGEGYGFGHKSYEHGYEQESLLLNLLLEYYKTNRSDLAAVCLLSAASYAIRFEFSDAKGNNDNSITYYQFGLDACEKVFEIRALAFQSLCLLLENESFHTIAKNELLRYSVPKDSEINREIAVHDISVLESILSATAHSKNFDHCEILDHFHGVCKHLQIACPKVFLRYCYNRVYRLYRALQPKDEHGRYVSWQKLEPVQKQTITKPFWRATDSDLKSLWKRLAEEESRTNSSTVWKFSSGIEGLFSCLSEMDGNRFLHDLEIYIGMQAPYGGNRFSVIDGLLNVLPFDQAIRFLKEHGFRFQKRWLILAYDSIPDGSITENVCDELINSLNTEPTDVYNISMRTAFRLTQKYPSFLMRYMTALNVAGEKAPYLLTDFLNGLDETSQPTVFAIVDYFSDNLDILCTAYTLALQMQTFYDHEGQLLIQLVRGKESFLHDLISVLVYKKCTKNNFPPFDALWNEDNYINLATLVMETLMSIGQSPHDWSFTVVLDKIGEEMYGYSSDPKISERKRIWLNRYIALNAEDTDKMVFLFSIICNGTADILQNAVSIFCRHNKSYPTFVKLDIEPTHFAWTGSEVPLLEERIANLEIMKESLSGYEYIEHRERIAELIQSLRRQREEELLKDFLRGQR